MIALATAALLAASGLALASARPAAADTAVGDWPGLKAAFLAGGAITLTGPITGENAEGLDVPGGSGSVQLDLAGYTLDIPAPSSRAGIRVPVGSTLTVSDSSVAGTGTLIARGGNESAGIGGSQGGGTSAGNVTIAGGNVTANGGFRGSGIGGGRYGAGGNVVIIGGTLTANGGDWSSGVGAGSQAGSPGTITVAGTLLPGSNGTTGGSYAPSGVADPSYGAPVTMSADARYVRVLKQDNISNRRGAFSVAYAPAGTVLPTIATTSLVAAEGGAPYSDTIDFAGEPAPAVSVTDGVLPLGLSLSATGTLSGTPLVPGDYEFTVTATSTVLDLQQTASQAYELSVAPGDPWALLQARFAAGGSWSLDDDLTAPAGEGLVVPAGLAVTLDLGEHTLEIDPDVFGVAAIEVPAGASFTAQHGTLLLTGGYNAAALGGGGEEQPSGSITLDDVDLTAVGGYNGAGIGGSAYAGAGPVSIADSEVSATGGWNAAGIGGGLQGDGGSVTATRGEVVATGGTAGAGIGGGYGRAGGAVTATDSDVTATGGLNAAGIGGGVQGSGGTLSVDGGSILATGGQWAAAVGAGDGGADGGSVTVAGVQLPGSSSTTGANTGLDGAPGAALAFTWAGRLVRTLALDSATSAPSTFSVTYAEEDAALPAISTGSLPIGYRDEAYEQQIDFSGIPEPTIEVSAGALPDGLAIDGDGLISGTPTALGTSSFTVTVRSAILGLDQSASQAYDLVVLDRAVEELRAALASGGEHALTKDVSLQPGDFLRVGAAAVLDLAGHDLTIQAPGDYRAAINVPQSLSLTITDSVGGGTLDATGGGYAAGIGGGTGNSWEPNAGTIVIDGGDIVVRGGSGGAALGGALYGGYDAITINGGEVTATSPGGGAAIGAGEYSSLYGSPGPITVTGGDVTAIGLGQGAAIGGGTSSYGAAVTISGGRVDAQGRDESTFGGVGIGVGNSWGSGYPVGTLTVDAQPLQGSTGLGGGENLTAAGYYGALAAAVSYTGGANFAKIVTTDAAPPVARGVVIEIVPAEEVPGFAVEADQDVYLGEPVSLRLTTPGTETVELVGGTLPPGLELSESGELSGTPTVLGTEAFELSVSGTVLGLPQTSTRVFTVSTLLRAWEDLQAAFLAGGQVTLDQSLVAPLGEALVVGPGVVVELDLAGNALTIPAPSAAVPAITVPADATLTIEDETGVGTLTAFGGADAAGIGSAAGELPGSVAILGGTVTATGGGEDGVSGGAGIGAGWGVTDIGSAYLAIEGDTWPGSAVDGGSGGLGGAAALPITVSGGPHPTTYRAASVAGWAGTTTIEIGHTVAFDALGGTPAPEAQFVLPGAFAAAPPTPVLGDHTFTGWYAGGPEPFAFDTTPVTQQLLLTAEWTIGVVQGTVTFPDWFDGSAGAGAGAGSVAAVPLQGGPSTAVDLSDYDAETGTATYLIGLAPGQYVLQYLPVQGSGLAAQYWPGVTTVGAAEPVVVGTDGTQVVDLSIGGAAITGIVEIPAVPDPADFVQLWVDVVAGGIIVDQVLLDYPDTSGDPIEQPFQVTVPAGTTDYSLRALGVVRDDCSCLLVSTWSATWTPSAPLGSDPSPVDIGVLTLGPSTLVQGVVAGTPTEDSAFQVVPVPYRQTASGWQQLDVIDDPDLQWAFDFGWLTGEPEADQPDWDTGLLEPGTYRFGFLLLDAFSGEEHATWFANDLGGSPAWSDAQSYVVAADTPLVIPEQTLGFEPVAELENLVAPAIEGAAQVGRALTANPGVWSPAPPFPVDSPCGCGSSFAYQWFADYGAGAEPISGAIGQVFRPQAEHIGARLSVQVTATVDGLEPVAFGTQQTVPVAEGVFAPVPTPVLSGSRRIGSVLSVDARASQWGPAAPTTIVYDWLRDGVSLELPVDTTSYELTLDDATHVIAVRVTGSRAGFAAASALSNAKAVTELTPGVPSVSGTLKVGSMLTADPGAWDPAPVAFSYRWYTVEQDLTTRALVQEGGSATYTPSGADVGKYVYVVVDGSKAGFQPAAAQSAWRGFVVSAVLTPGAAVVTGSLQVGSVLTADVGTWAPAPVALSYRWYSVAPDLVTRVLVQQGASATYVPTAADLGKYVYVVVEGSKPGYATVAAQSPWRGYVAAGVLTAGVPVVTGTLGVGAVLTADPGSWAEAPVTASYRWYTVEADLVTRALVQQGASATYVPSASDAGKYVYVVVDASKDGYLGSAAQSAWRGFVLP
ncbi:MAG: hypothetical protein J7480_04040 [Microbacteriaceae bacterium]|nr:hypothetical protein [Microbacteriaceae bacterium]